MSSATAKSILLVALTAALVVIASDVTIHRLSPYSHVREAGDGLRDLEHQDPTIIVVGSSYARSFNVVARELSKLTSGRQRMIDIPLEFGKLSSYAWMLDNRIAPLVDEKNSGGARKRPSLERLLIVTEWWDSCHIDKPANIPGRLWTWDDFISSVEKEGINSYNRNYLQYRWRLLFSDSALVQYRGSSGPIDIALRKLLGRPPKPTHDPDAVARFYQDGISGVKCIGDPVEMASLEHLLQFAVSKNIQATVVLFPFMPSMQSPEARSTTYRQFLEQTQRLTSKYGSQVVDLVTPSPLEDDDWLPDCEHLNSRGNERFAEWTLRGPLAFLRASPEQHNHVVQQ